MCRFHRLEACRCTLQLFLTTQTLRSTTEKACANPNAYKRTLVHVQHTRTCVCVCVYNRACASACAANVAFAATGPRCTCVCVCVHVVCGAPHVVRIRVRVHVCHGCACMRARACAFFLPPRPQPPQLTFATVATHRSSSVPQLQHPRATYATACSR